MIARLFLLFLCVISFPKSLSATHLMGGEITWECQGNGNYIFTMKIYRDCFGNQLQFPVGLRVHNHPSVQGIPLNLVSQTDITPQCNPLGNNFTCADGDQGAVEEFVFRSNSINLPGVPPPQGWVFTFDNCCRNAAISNLIINPSETGITLRAIMYSYNGIDGSPCYDSSPVFSQVPAVIICTNNAFTYNHNAFDSDKDSLRYSFANPLDWLDGAAYILESNLYIPFQSAYTVQSPFPGPGQNNSVPATINPVTGEISFTPRQTGNFVTVVKVESFRCGQLISEIYREIQVVITECELNNAPIATAPFNDPTTGLLTAFTTTVEAGDLVSFNITATDNDISIIGIPQIISVFASGGQFGNNFTDPNNGCTNPPCATLSPAPPTVLANNGTITFNWQTSCDHVALLSDCYVPASTHTFVLTFKDDFCPAPAYRMVTVSVVVTAPPVLPAPSFRCVDILDNGDITLSWMPVTDPEGYFNSYHIYSATSPGGPFTVIDSVFNINQSTYTHLAAGGNTQTRYYYIKTRSGCGGLVFSDPTPTLQSIFLTVSDLGAGQIELNWNALATPNLPSSTLPYRIDREYNPDPFVAFATSNAFQLDDQIQGCLQEIHYEVFLNDASGCISSSNIDGGIFSNDEAPDPPIMDSISIQLNGTSVYLGWQASPSGDTDAYIIYQIIGSTITALDTVYGINNTFYSNSALALTDGPVSLAVAALDVCLQEGEMATTQTSIYLEHNLVSCEGRVYLNWSAYGGWSSTVSQYQILQSVNGGAYTLSATVNGNILQTSIPQLIPAATYCFVIRAISSNSSSTSNTVCFQANVQDLPDFAYTRKATIVNNGPAYSECIIDNMADIASYKVLRAIYPSVNFDTIFTGNINPALNQLSYTDVAVTPYNQSYIYKYALIDKCDNPSVISNPARTILLQGVALDGFVNRLFWNPYSEWDAGVGQYRLFRSLDKGATFSEIWNSTSDTTFQDIVASEVDTLMQFCYYVEAVENEINSYGVRDTSRSNYVCLFQKTTIWIPSAFRPGNSSVNYFFKGIGLYENLASEHTFSIFNRWGELLFFTKDPKQPWDGKYLDRVVPTGIYVYKIRFKLPDGSTINRVGSVMVLD
jgi:gliding motility-associated-like protein